MPRMQADEVYWLDLGVYSDCTLVLPVTLDRDIGQLARGEQFIITKVTGSTKVQSEYTPKSSQYCYYHIK
jgi:hypothetical protein